MRTILEIQRAINVLVDEAREAEHDLDKKRLVSANKTRIAFLEICKRYIETNPTPEFITKERNRLNNRLEKIDKEFDYYLMYKIGDKVELRKKYNKEYGVDKLHNQLRALDFILNETGTQIQK